MAASALCWIVLYESEGRAVTMWIGVYDLVDRIDEHACRRRS